MKNQTENVGKQIKELEKVIEVLIVAIPREEATYKFYQELARSTKHEGTRRMFIKVANQKLSHKGAKQIYSSFDIPFIYLTAYADDKILEQIKITEPFGYIVKPFTNEDLKIAIELALYKHKAEGKRRKQIQDLSNALAKTRALSGRLHICPFCKKIRDKEGDWKLVEDFIREHSDAEFKRIACPVCTKIRNT